MNNITSIPRDKNIICFGTWQIAKSCLSTKEKESFIKTIIDNYEISLFDIGITYNEVDDLFGNINYTYRKDLTIILKSLIYNNSVHSTINSIKQSFKKMKITTADFFLLHKIDKRFDINLFLELKRHLLEGGLFNKIGVSLNSPFDIKDLNWINHFDAIQVPFNPILQDAKNILFNKKKIIFSRGIFLFGKLFKENYINEFNSFNFIHNQALKFKMDISELLFRYQLNYIDYFNSIVIGTASISHISELFNYLKKGPLPNEIFKEIDNYN